MSAPRPTCRPRHDGRRPQSHAAKTRPPSARSITDAAHAIEIRRVWTANYSCYGPRRVYKQLRREGHVVARCTVTRIMRDLGLRGVQRGRKQFTTTPDDTSTRPADLVERAIRRMTVEAP